MRILILTTQDKFFLSHISERAKYLKEKGWDVFVAAQLTNIKYQEKIEQQGFHFFDTKIERKNVNPVSFICALIRLNKIYNNVSPDLCYHLGAKAIFAGTIIAKLFLKKAKIVNAPIGLGFVYTSQSFKARCLRPLVDLMYRLTLNPCGSKVIVENHDDIEYFISKAALKRTSAYCIPGAGVNVEIFRPEKKNDVITIVMAARFIKEKGIWDYVKAAEVLYRDKIPVRIQLVGAPDYGNPSSITKVEFDRIRNHPAIEYLGFREDMQNIFNHAHICCLPSYREGLPRVLVEAASSGMAIITTDSVGCRETVNGKNGVLIPIRGVDQIVSSVKNYVHNPSKLLYAQQESRDLALKKFDTRIICKATYDVFIQLLSK